MSAKRRKTSAAATDASADAKTKPVVKVEVDSGLASSSVDVVDAAGSASSSPSRRGRQAPVQAQGQGAAARARKIKEEDQGQRTMKLKKVETAATHIDAGGALFAATAESVIVIDEGSEDADAVEAVAAKPSKSKKKQSAGKVPSKGSGAAVDIEECAADSSCQRHALRSCAAIQDALLQWYDKHHRVLPWRQSVAQPSPALHGSSVQQKAYAVWVSEIMCQQTQIATVLAYYERWMGLWPTVHALAAASLDDVHKVWAGLGYYSRATRLHSGAQALVAKSDGCLPTTAEALARDVPGIGPYTAAAIASIAFGERKGAVDGNAIRVHSRLTAVGGDQKAKAVCTHLWQTADALAQHDRPGDINQAVMELGALVCTPQKPKCSECPLKQHCTAALVCANSKQVASPHNSKCVLCGDAPITDVTQLPRKTPKKAPTPETLAVAVIYFEDREAGCKKFLTVQRPATGLLANMWEFPNYTTADDTKDHASTLTEKSGVSCEWRPAGTVKHVFSHLVHTYVVMTAKVDGEADARLAPLQLQTRASQWLSEDELAKAAVSTNMRKVFAQALQSLSKPQPLSKQKGGAKGTKKQLTLAGFLS
eukprot:m.141351 g.141351  ORF g.141351 m.141351 type:complete len:595 (+) comp16692_c0_seq1:73-1857(+)